MKRASNDPMRTLLLTLVASFAVACGDSGDGATSDVGGGTSAGTGGSSPGKPVPGPEEGALLEGTSSQRAGNFEENDASCNAAEPLIQVSLPRGFEPALATGQYVDSMLKQGFLPDPSALRFEPLRAYLENRDATNRLEAWVEPRGSDSLRLQIRHRASLMGTMPSQPSHVVVVLDVSSSMAQSATLRDDELAALAEHLDQAQIRFSLVTFAGEATRLIEDAAVGDASGALVAASTQLIPGEGHNLSAGLKEAAALLDTKDGSQLLVLTDGGFTADEAALEQVRSLRAQGVLLSAVQLAVPAGFQRNEGAKAQTSLHFDMLTELAKAGGGFALFSNGDSFSPDSWVPSLSTQPALALELPGTLPPLDSFVGEAVADRKLPNAVTETASVTLSTHCLEGEGPFSLTIDGQPFSLQQVAGQWRLQDSVRAKADEKLQAVVQALRTQTPPNAEMLPGDFVCEALAAFSSPVACGTSGLDPSCGYAKQVDDFYKTVCSEFCGSCDAF